MTGGETKYEYDTNGNRTKVIAPNGATTQFEYDNFNQLTKEISPDRGTTTYQYDVSGNQIQITDAKGNIKNISYDILNRKTGESWVNHPDLTIAYSYDTCRIGNLCKTTDKSGSTTLSYDNEGKVTQKDSDIEGVVLSLKYSYTDDDKLQSITYPSGKVIDYSYDVDKINGISIDGSPLITDISYNATSQLTGWRWSNGTAYTKAYDTNGRLKTFPLGDKTRTLTYDKLGNITGWSDSDGEAKQFGYDLLSRLTAYSNLDGAGTVKQSQNFTYDANGNRLDLTEIEGTSQEIQTVYSILENSNRLSSSLSGVEGAAYQYDANGNITNDGEHTYNYDARNRLTGVDDSSSYLFNANNMRVKKTTPAGTILYGWDNERIFAEYDGSGTAIQETIYFGNTPIALLKDDNAYRIFVDQIDTPRVLTDSTNTTLWSWNSKPFGESAPDKDVDKDGTSLSYNLRFPGQYFDSETGKHYNFNRDYDPVTGRYIQSDPIGLDGGENSYIYADSNSIVNSDNAGLKTAVIHNGKTSGNPFGHTAISFTGRGIYSFGNTTPLGSSLISYMIREMPRRNTGVSIINTTREQENRMVNFIRQYKDDVGYFDNCAFRTASTLDLLYQDLPWWRRVFAPPSRPGLMCWLPIQVETTQAPYYIAAFGGKYFNIPKKNGTWYARRNAIPNELNGAW